MKSYEITITQNEYLIELENNELIKLDKLPLKKFNVDDIKITAFNESVIYKGFADYSLNRTNKTINNRPSFNPLVTAVIENKTKPFCSIIGLWEVLFINVQTKTLEIILKLNRTESDDRGFYFLKILTLKDAFLIIYESGIARISNNGKIKFHRSLRWDDIYCKTDENYIYYSSEHLKNEDWRVNIKNGEIVENWM
jgi:hypothetical protein